MQTTEIKMLSDQQQAPNSQQAPTPRPGILIRLCASISGHDADLVQETNRLEKSSVKFQAITLVWAFAFAWILYFAFLSLVLNPTQAIVISGFIACGIYLLDRSIVASDWSPAGVLRKGMSHDTDYWVRLFLRVAISVTLSYLTAVGAVSWIYQDEIKQWLSEDTAKRNKPLFDEYKQRISKDKEEITKSQIAPLAKELADLQDERKAMTAATSTTISNAVDFENNAAKARVEAGRELTGGLLGYVAGRGGRYLEAQRQEAEAALAAKRAESRANEMRTRIAEIDKRIDAKQQEISKTNASIHQREQTLNKERESDVRLLKVATDPLSLQRGLAGLKDDPLKGGVITENAFLLKLGIIILELIPLLIKSVFGVGSILAVRYTARLKREAALEAAEFAVARDAANARRPHLHVAGGREFRPQPEAAGGVNG
jgi:hypothetical protein